MKNNNINKIKKLYVVHHSHTDIGYTDLQERIIYVQADYIRTALKIMKKPENEMFRWNCETYFCVEKFLEIATDMEREEFFTLVSEGKIGISGTYLNATDLMDTDIYEERLGEMVSMFQKHGTKVKTAMIADINGISMGQRDAMIENGIDFLYTNIHCHHGMYPLYHNQNAYFWENKDGKKILVWNGEHYNLGNVLGIGPNRNDDGKGNFEEETEMLHQNLMKYVELYESENYPYSFMIASVSGIFSDNAPPNTKILERIEAFNKAYGKDIIIQMVSLQELYENIRETLQDVPVYKGDMTDWWANGVGSAPYAVKHYKEAVRLYHLCERLDSDVSVKYPKLRRVAQDNLLLYAEHTWGHSAAITNPYETMVLNLDMRKNSYASKAHESSALILAQTAKGLGDTLRYYKTEGKIRIINVTKLSGKMKAEFYVEGSMKNALLTNTVTGEIVKCQTSAHPRGVLISFMDDFSKGEQKEYAYRELPIQKEWMNSFAYLGEGDVRELVNNYDSMSCRFAYEFENKWFYLSYEKGSGIKKFINKSTGKSLLREESDMFFTPIYEETKITTSPGEERRCLGRNHTGKHAKKYIGRLTEVSCIERGNVFTTLKFVFKLKGTNHTEVIVKLYEDSPRIDYKLRIAKKSSTNIESVYMPMTLTLGEESAWLKKGKEAFRPGIDQIPGTCMEYYMTDEGVVFSGKEQSISIISYDVPLVTMGELKHHSVKLCDGKEENNRRPLYSWVMNNMWETNFKLDLGGYSEFCYSLTLNDTVDAEEVFMEMKEREFETYALMID